MAKETITETQQKQQIAELQGALTDISERYSTVDFVLQERLAELDRVMGDDTWLPILSYGQEGPSIDQLVKRSNQIRVAATLNPHVKRGAKLRFSYVWSDQIDYSGVPGMGEQPGRGQANVGVRVDDPINQRYVFSALAHEEREMSLYTDGGFFLVGDDRTRQLRPISLNQISGLYTNDDDPSEVWAYRRLWYTDGGITPNVEWIFNELFK
jgi:hypothetical protein